MEIVTLNEAFYCRHANHLEILKNKDGRPYVVILIKNDDHTFAIPFRTNGRRPKTSPRKPKSCYFFSSSGRKEKSASGRIPVIDFSKSVVITDADKGAPAFIDESEFQELNSNWSKIQKDFDAFLNYYKDSVKNNMNMNEPEIKYSALQYFNDVLLMDVKPT